MTGPTTPHSTLLRNVYVWLMALGDRYHVPGWLREVLGGIVLLGVPTLFFLIFPLWLVLFLLASGGNALWGLRLDPNDAGKPSEIPDGLIREGVIILGLILLHLVHVV